MGKSMDKQRPLRKIIMTKGLPASGKSTYARKLCKQGYKRINKDDLRLMIDDGIWSKENEHTVVSARDLLLTVFMLEGHNIVIDDTNFNTEHTQSVREIIRMHNENIATTSLDPLPLYELEIKFFDVPVDTCIKRDALRPNPVGRKVIMDMYKRYLITPYVKPPKKPQAIICDIDGTLAHMLNRSPYDETLVHTDTVDEDIRNILQVYSKNTEPSLSKTSIIIVSGRHDTCKAETEKWLKDNGIEYSAIFMRKANDDRSDSVVKQEIFDKYIRNQYQVRFVLDDRNRVVDMWRANGLKVLQVAEGTF